MDLLRPTASLLLAPLLSAQVLPDVEFTELLVDPIGANAGAQVCELRHTGHVAATLAGWRLVTPAGAFVLPTLSLAPGDVLLLHLGAAGTNTPRDVHLPTVPPLPAAGSLALFRSAALTDPTALVDFVSFGGGQATIGLAVAAGQWPSLQETVPLPAHEGATLAHYDRVTYGSRSEAAAWFADRTPTLGHANDGGGIFAEGYGCPLSLTGPLLGAGEDDNRPWIGANWRLDTGSLPTLPTLLWLAIGVQPIASVPLDPFGIPGCVWSTAPDIVFTRSVATYPGPIFVPLPADPLLVGYPLRLQALVPAPGANAAGLLPTRALLAYPGSR
jgi:hypothetical protein